MENIRGIECSLYNGRIKDVLCYLANKPFDFYIHRCMKIESNDMLLPTTSNDFCLSSSNLKKLAKNTIWELVMYAYPTDSDIQIIETYDDYIHSACACCLIFYDCGLIDIYVKDATFREQLYVLLCALGATDIALITDTSDCRTYMR